MNKLFLIADEIIRLHNGSLVIKSELHFGTEIIITIPKVEGAEIYYEK